MEDNTKVLACRIDRKLHDDMKKYIAGKMTVKDYITGLIERDLEKDMIQEKSDLNKQPIKENEKEKLAIDVKKENSKELPVEEHKKEDNKKSENSAVRIGEKKEELKQEDSKEKTIIDGKKESLKKSPMQENKKELLSMVDKKQKVKKNQKEEEEEFE